MKFYQEYPLQKARWHWEIEDIESENAVNGTKRDITDKDGVLKQRYSYSAYGITSIEKTNSPGNTELLENPFGFTSREWEIETGDYYHRTRYRDPVSGRWLSEDRIGFSGGDVNLYSYVKNNPTNYKDSMGFKIDWGNYVIGNPLVYLNFINLNQTLGNMGFPDNSFSLKVTGGDRYKDACGKIRSLTNNEIIGNASARSPHLTERGARGLDFNAINVPDWAVDIAISNTLFDPTQILRNYDNPHTHINLPNKIEYWLPKLNNPQVGE